LVAPSAIYPINDYFATGVGLQGSFVNAKNYIGHSYTCKILGGSLIFLGVFITFISTWLALNKYLKMKIDDLY